MVTARLWWRIAVFPMCLMVISCAARPNESATVAKANKSDLIAGELSRCPLWKGLPEHDIARRKEITDVFLDVAKYDTSTLRAGIVAYLNRYPALSPQIDDAGYEIFAFLRVVFLVPPHFGTTRESLRSLPFSLLGNPVHDDGVDLLWPYSIDHDGHLHLTGFILGLHSGPPYDPLADFDQMAQRLERRFPVSR